MLKSTLRRWLLVYINVPVYLAGATVRSSTPTPSSQTEQSLLNAGITSAPPLCIQGSQAESIKKSITKNKTSDHKYDDLRAALNEDNDETVFARLIYAETLAANCSEEIDKILPAITLVISNRILKRRGNIRGLARRLVEID